MKTRPIILAANCLYNIVYALNVIQRFQTFNNSRKDKICLRVYKTSRIGMRLISAYIFDNSVSSLQERLNNALNHKKYIIYRAKRSSGLRY